MRVPALALLVTAVVAGVVGAGIPARATSSGCADGGDRKTKLTLIERLTQTPQILILGSSRARPAEPSVLKSLSGRSAFNAGVQGGTAADAWVATRLTADLFPGRKRQYIWFVDVGIATNGVNPELASDPRARPYLGADANTRRSTCPVTSTYLPSGEIAAPYRASPKRAEVVASGVAKIVASIDANPPRPATIDPRRYVYFERTLAFMNEHGSRPVIVLNPIHPTVLAALQRYGFPARKAAEEYFRRLGNVRDFVLVDCEDIRTWGGSVDHFSEATHIDRVNMRRMLVHIVARSQGILG